MKNLLLVTLYVILFSFCFSTNYMLSALKELKEPVYIDQIGFFLTVGNGIEQKNFRAIAESLMKNINWAVIFKTYESYGIKIIQAPSMNEVIDGDENAMAISISKSDGNRKVQWQGTEINSVHRYYGRIHLQVDIDPIAGVESTSKYTFAIYDGTMWDEEGKFELLFQDGFVYEGMEIRNFDEILSAINSKWADVVKANIKETAIGKPWF